MIALVFLKYKDNADLDMLITTYVNDKLEGIIHFALDYIDDSSDVERFSPQRFFAHSTEECLLIIKELHTFSQDFALHKDLSPKYQFFLYRILDWYINISSEIEEDDPSLKDSLLLYEMDDSLKEQITSHYGSSAVDRFSNVKNYLVEFFNDWDFIPDFLANVVQLYLEGSPAFDNFTSIEELGNYVELMDGDTLIKYQTICIQRDAENRQQEILFKDFDTNLSRALNSIQRDSDCWNLDENRLNDKLCALLRMIYTVSDQSRQELSLSQKNAGEVDFLVFDNEEPIAIMEALKLGGIDSKELNDHITKLLVNYDPQGYRRSYLIIYVTKQDFGAFWKGFCDYISTYSFQYPVKEKFAEIQSPYTEFRSAYIVLLRSGTPVILSFYAIHMPKREENNE